MSLKPNPNKYFLPLKNEWLKKKKKRKAEETVVQFQSV